MRSDQTLDQPTFTASDDWQFDAIEQSAKPEIDSRYEQGGVEVEGKQLRHSFSGHERNCWFHNDGAGGFTDLSALSGVDNIADGRAHVVWDFDRDGRQDIALVNANEPFLNVYHNRISSQPNSSQTNTTNGFVAIRLVGGNQAEEPSAQFSNRDGYGAIVTVELADRTITREHRCGEGFAAQNSSTMLIGIWDAVEVAAVSVDWPSGKSTHIDTVNVGSELTVYEDSKLAPNSNGFASRPYIDDRVANSFLAPPKRETIALRGFDEILSKADKHVIVSMATWCDACKRELPQIAALRSAFSATDVGLWAVPIDPIDNSKKLAAYVERFRPDYSLVPSLNAQQIGSFQKVLRRTNPSTPLPMSVIVSSRGEVLSVMNGIPTVSDVGIAGLR